MTTITTVVKSSANGAGVVLAKGAGRQKSTRFDHSLSIPANHGAAAGNLAKVLGLDWSDDITHTTKQGTGDLSTKHIFTFPA